jgi:hypothetical protein
MSILVARGSIQEKRVTDSSSVIRNATSFSHLLWFVKSKRGLKTCCRNKDNLPRRNALGNGFREHLCAKIAETNVLYDAYDRYLI